MRVVTRKVKKEVSKMAEEKKQEEEKDVKEQKVGSENEEKTLAVLAHILGILTGFVAPLIIYLIKTEKDSLARDQAREALNFQITVAIAVLVSGLSMFVIVGFVLLPAVYVADIVFGIVAAARTNKNEKYRYPVAIRFIK